MSKDSPLPPLPPLPPASPVPPTTSTPPSPPAPRSRDDFEVAVICALSREGNAVEALFDEIWHDAANTIGLDSRDNNTYTFGFIGSHYVVLTWMPEMGSSKATAAAIHLKFSFTKIKHFLVVGICGGVPYKPKPKGGEILLGDVIIGDALIKYDCGKQYHDKYTEREPTCKPDSEMLGVLNKLRAASSYKRLEKISTGYIEELLNTEDFLEARYPGAHEDKLYKSDYLHKHHDISSRCGCTKDEKEEDLICNNATNISCTELKCDENFLLHRNRLMKITEAAEKAPTKAPNPTIHIGAIASGNTVMKSSKHRDVIAQRHQVIAFEMEGAGVFDEIPSVVVIKGVCDYSDSHKNKNWQAYAAVTAAASMKAFLELKAEFQGKSWLRKVTDTVVSDDIYVATYWTFANIP
jgi:nucleoside phosphorylase